MANLPQIQFENLFEQDPTGQKIWVFLLGKPTFSDLKNVYSRMGKNGAVATAASALTDKYPPQIRTHNAVGDRIDKIDHHSAYYELQKLSYGSDIVSLKYDKNFLEKYKNHRHLIGFSIAYYFAQTETGLFCPICMTDALARVLEKHPKHPMAQKALKHLASSDLNTFWSGAMFLTEKQGGSDVGANTVRAEVRNERWYLYGDKWFCSNADAQASLVLARMPGSAGELSQGTRGLGLFLVLRNDPVDNHKTWLTHRLKDKLGVKTMASGEITFNGTEAFLIGGENEGFKIMTEMVNMSRIYNAVSSIAIVRRALMEAYAFGRERSAFGSLLVNLPLWRACIADLAAEFYAHQVLVFEATRQLDLSDNNNAEGAKLARLMTPLAKALTGKLSVFAASEAMELIGGNAYIEEHILPRLLRDAQVLPIWEGTTNIQSLDLLRALQKEGSDVFFKRCEVAIAQYESKTALKTFLQSRLMQLKELLSNVAQLSKEDSQRVSREVLEKMGRLLSACLLAEATKDPTLKDICEAALQRILLRESATSPLGGTSAVKLATTEDILLSSIL